MSNNKIERDDLWSIVSRAIYMREMFLLCRTIHKLLTGVGFPNYAYETHCRSVLQVAFMAAKGLECRNEYQDFYDKLYHVWRSKSYRIITVLKLMDTTNERTMRIHRQAQETLEQTQGYAQGQAADVIAGCQDKRSRSLFGLDEFGKECNQFQVMRRS
jgi:hypothetical protein